MYPESYPRDSCFLENRSHAYCNSCCRVYLLGRGAPAAGDSWCCLRATLIGKNRSWWVVRHGDGSVQKYNGGKFPGRCLWFQNSISDAWAHAIRWAAIDYGCAVSLHCGNDWQLRCLDRITKMVRCAMSEAYDAGAIITQTEGCLVTEQER